MTTLAEAGIERALVIDDDEGDRATVRMHLEDFGLDVSAPDRPYASVEELTQFVESEQVDVTICDHRLQPRGLAAFYGAEAVASLVKKAKVAILVTSFRDQDYDTTIRAYRRYIPALLGRHDLDSPEVLERVVSEVRSEMSGHIRPARRLWPTAIVIATVSVEGGRDVFDAFIPGWRPHQAVRFPIALLPEALHHRAKELEGASLLAEVNIGAGGPEDLYLGAVEEIQAVADWPVAEFGKGAKLPIRHDAPPGLFEGT